MSNNNFNVYFSEMLEKQNKLVDRTKKLQFNDLKRISKYINNSIFNDNKCCIWTGYITNEKNTNKGTYINFYFRKKKVALHRLLYINFVDNLDNTDYLKFNCPNKGKCCNVNHMKKFKYHNFETYDDVVVVKKKKNFKHYNFDDDFNNDNMIIMFD
jgi:hypothetical protein